MSGRLTPSRRFGGGPASGDGFVSTTDGEQRWGRYGAAGVLLVGLAAGEPRVFLTRRSPLTHHGNTWALPGGALDRDEPPVAAGLREFTEEIGPLPEHTVVGAEAVTEGGWTYHYVLAETSTMWHPPRQLSWEITAARWVPLDRVAEMRLHPGFARAWPGLADGIRTRHPATPR